ncbi:MAG TPA: cupin-like domain-containing protein [Allosphingosinicella sp.]
MEVEAQDRTQEPGGRVAEWHGVNPERFANEVRSRYEPAVLRGFIADWPAVAACRSTEGAQAYLARFDRGAPVRAWVGPGDIEGRFFYRPEMVGFNFGITEAPLAKIVGKIVEDAGQEQRFSIYMGSTPVPEVLPGFERENPMPALAATDAVPRIWIGTETNVAPHFDESDNVACVVRGRRRFVLFPPDEVKNLYVGPIDQTPAGQPTSMVDMAKPDFERFPRFRKALERALVADLEPGDAIYVPALWWHAVRAFDPLNILVNYWWQEAPPDATSAMHALGHGLLTISQLPPEKRAAWRALFDHYVFRLEGDPTEHIPPAARGILGESTPQLRGAIRQFLIRQLQGRP